ncbi:hypothetical protein H6P81_011984 [Aristolochia fimbriata]|uniref:RING-type E3 ubiquitin transferase n=1 Tax=Aristolochia fimbriata TaxID=158543 RepID=A0AAV7EDC8_ARIFI|nr:hypothetical protein H6P81_011984 [Aristolochia fimbriata]
MWNNGSDEKRIHGSVAVAIDMDKGSQYALNWATEELLNRGDTVILIHVLTTPQSLPNPPWNQVAASDVNGAASDANDAGASAAIREAKNSNAENLFLPFRSFCDSKNIQCKEVVLEDRDKDVSTAVVDYISRNAIEHLVISASGRNDFIRKFKETDIPTGVCERAPEFCTVYVISKGKISSVRSATNPPVPTEIHSLPSIVKEQSETPATQAPVAAAPSPTGPPAAAPSRKLANWLSSPKSVLLVSAVATLGLAWALSRSSSNSWFSSSKFLSFFYKN